MATFGAEHLGLTGKPAILGLVAEPHDPIAQASSFFGTTDATPTVRVSLFDTGATAGDQVRLKVDGQVGPAAVVTAHDLQNGYVDIASDGLGEGVHLVSAVVVDASGLAGPRSTAFPVRVDTTAPEVRLEGVVGADSGQALSDGGLTHDHALVFRFAVDDQTAPSAVAGQGGGHNIYAGLAADMRLELFANGVLVGATAVSGPSADGLVEIRSDTLAAGDYVFTLVARDAAGNVGFTAEPFDLGVVDNARLDASVEAPAFGTEAFALTPNGWASGWVIEV